MVVQFSSQGNIIGILLTSFHRTKTNKSEERNPLSNCVSWFWIQKIFATHEERRWWRYLCLKPLLNVLSLFCPLQLRGPGGTLMGTSSSISSPPLPFRVWEQRWLHVDHPCRARGHHCAGLHWFPARRRIRLLRDQRDRSTVHMVSAGQETSFFLALFFWLLKCNL